MRKGNLVRIRPSIAECANDFELRASKYDVVIDQSGEETVSRYIFCGAWPLTPEERDQLRKEKPYKEPPIKKHVPLEANVYLLEAARVVAKDLAFNDFASRYWGMAIIRDLITGQCAYVEREALELVNSTKKYKMRHCVVKKQWLLEKA